MLPASVHGLDVVELGCGTAYVSAWLARRGALPVGVDITPAQLATARAMQARFGLEFPLVEASAEAVPLPVLRPYVGMHRFEWEESDSVEFQLGHGDWIRLLRGSGFEVIDLVELQAPETGDEHRYPGLPERWWARKWPSEEIRRARKR
ncbi:MAG: class I SAM-dependent methyltransferase [Gaiellaceae bacterium]